MTSLPSQPNGSGDSLRPRRTLLDPVGTPLAFLFPALPMALYACMA